MSASREHTDIWFYVLNKLSGGDNSYLLLGSINCIDNFTDQYNYIIGLVFSGDSICIFVY